MPVINGGSPDLSPNLEDDLQSQLRRQMRADSLKLRNHFVNLVREWHAARSEHTNIGDSPIPRWDGGVDRFDRRFRPVWPKILDFCQKIKANPFDYLTAQFDRYSLSMYPDPLRIMGPKGVEKYDLWKGKFAYNPGRISSELEIVAFEKAKRSFRIRLGQSEDDIVRSIVSDPALKISTLVRFCVAYQRGFDDLSDRFFQESLVQYSSDQKSFDSILGPLIPQILRDRVALSDSSVAGQLPAEDPIFSEPLSIGSRRGERRLRVSGPSDSSRLVDLFSD